jgi:hypothetical protein
VAFRIRVAIRAFCRERVAGQFGVFAATPESVPRRYRSFASEAMNMTWLRPTIISLVEGSPAAKRGSSRRDRRLQRRAHPGHRHGEMDGQVAQAQRRKAVKVNLRRGGEDMTVTVTPVIGCSIPVH